MDYQSFFEQKMKVCVSHGFFALDRGLSIVKIGKSLMNKTDT